MAYNRPSMKMELMASFLLSGICNWKIGFMGKVRMQKSVMMLGIACPRRKARRL